MERTLSVNSAASRLLVAGMLIVLSIALRGAAPAQSPPGESKEERGQRMAWWSEARFGMFIHWGLYAIPAGEWKGEKNHGEWIRTTAEIPLNEYDKLVGRFNPVKFDPRAWVRMAKDAGMKYIVITSKHHDGFSLFGSRHTDFDVMSTPFGRDILKELSAACREEGMRLCFYYSIMDWHHPDYLPRRGWEKDRPAGSADVSRYREYMKHQLKELLTGYGDIGVLWFDGEWESTWNDSLGRELYDYVRSLEPNIIINNRVGVGRSGMEGFSKDESSPGDFGTPEQEIPAKGLPGISWESCMTMNDHWGFNANDLNFKPTRELLRNLAEIASKGGNFLLNVGPTAEGAIPGASADRLREMGEWMKVNAEAITGTSASPFAELSGGYCTQKAVAGRTRLYFHIVDWPESGVWRIPGLLNAPGRAFLLSDPAKRPLSVVREEDALLVAVGPEPATPFHSVIALDIEGAPDVNDPPLIESSVPIFVRQCDVQVSSPRDRVEIRYTLDGSLPTAASPLVAGPIRIIASSTVSARAFRGEKPVSSAAEATFTKVVPRPSSGPRDPAAGIRFAYFEGEWDSLPSYGQMKSLKEGVLPNISFSPRNREELFGFDYAGWITVPEDDVYSFYTDSDDGSRLFIGDSLVVDNDGLHGMNERRGIIALAAGAHPIRVAFFEKTGGDDLKVSYESSRIKKQRIPDNAFIIDGRSQ